MGQTEATTGGGGLPPNSQPCLIFSSSLSCCPLSHTQLICDRVLHKRPVSDSLPQNLLRPDRLSHRPLGFPRDITSFLREPSVSAFASAARPCTNGLWGSRPCRLGPAAIFLFDVLVCLRKGQLTSQGATYQGLRCLGNLQSGDGGAMEAPVRGGGACRPFFWSGFFGVLPDRSSCRRFAFMWPLPPSKSAAD